MRHVITIVTALALSTGGCVSDADDAGASLMVHNHSDYVLTAVHVADVGNPHWGPNLLPDVLYPSEDLVIHDLDCGAYDVLVVDDNGVRCRLHYLDMCFHDEGWVVTNATLAACAFPR